MVLLSKRGEEIGKWAERGEPCHNMYRKRTLHALKKAILKFSKEEYNPMWKLASLFPTYRNIVVYGGMLLPRIPSALSL